MRVLAWLFAPLAFGLRRRAARVLHSFALAEHGSLLDLQLAAAQTPSPERAALYLAHGADEARHARIFAKRSAALRAELGLEPVGPVRADSEELYDRLGELDFVAFVHRGERRGCLQFEVYRHWFDRRGDAVMRDLFDAVLVDERRHESYTASLLLELADSPAQARAAQRRVARWEAWRMFRRSGRSIAQLVYAVGMGLLYLTLLPLWLLVRLVRPTRSGLRNVR